MNKGFLNIFIVIGLPKLWKYVIVANLEFTKPPILRGVKGADSPPVEV